MPHQAVNPYTFEKGLLYPDSTIDELAAAIDQGRRAQAAWGDISVTERAEYLPKLAAVLRRNVNTLATLATWEMGKHLREAKAEVEKCAACCDYFAEHGLVGLEDIVQVRGKGQARIGFRPLGIVFAVMPWNFPFWQVIRAAVPAVLAGNSVVLKHAQVVPGCAKALEDLFSEAGFPLGLFQNIYLSHNLTEEVLKHEAVTALTLTGSERAGQEVGMLAAKYVKKSVLELGGSDAFVVLADADIDLAAKSAAEARMINTGQSCVAAKRFIIEAPVYERFAVAFCHHLAAYTFRDPMDESVSFGPMVSESAAMHLQKQVDASLQAGATLRLKGGKGDGAFFFPTVLENIAPGMPAFEEEFFGPAASLFKAKDAADALRLANASPYGLGGSLWTADPEKGLAFAQRMQTGAVYINSIMKSDPALPFGGIKRSGHGRELSVFGLREFVNVQTVVF